jgi:cell division protein FtsQ
MAGEDLLDRIAEDEAPPRYLRRQKPAPVRSGSRGRRLRWVVRAGTTLLTAVALAWVVLWAYHSPVFALRPEAIVIHGAQNLPLEDVRAVFRQDVGRSVLRVPLERRRQQLEELDWVQQARVQRILPDRLVVTLVERTPVAWARLGSTVMLVDASGVFLRPPAGGGFSLPVVSGLESLEPAERARRLAALQQLLREMEQVHAGAAQAVSEADLSAADDVAVMLAGLEALHAGNPVKVHFGSGNFAERFRSLLSHFPLWQQQAGAIESVDLRLDGEAVVRPVNAAAVGAPALSASPPATEGKPVVAARPPGGRQR